VRKPAPAPASEPVSAPPPTKVDRLRAPTPASEPTQPSLERRARSGPPPALLVGLVLVIALTAGALLWWGRSAAPPQASVPAPRVTPPEPTPTKGPSAPEPRPEPPTEPKLDARPAPTVDAPPTKPRAPAKSARTAADVNRRWEALWKRSQRLPEDLRRLAQLKLTQAGDCSGSPDACWAELTELETTFFPK
jgi:hypothetical protein